jgi:predicted patatin/cPLA2 family phospholipase
VAPVKTCIERAKFKGLSYYSAGMDAHKHESQDKNIFHYCRIMNKLYHEMLSKEENYHKINTLLPEEESQHKVCDIIDNIINFKKYKELATKLKINT